VVAPVVGPTLGGWITDTYSWHWVFLINVPMGLLSLFLVGTLVNEPSGAEEERRAMQRKGLRVDYVGFALVAIGLGSLEFVLDEGQRKDWFGSNMIVGFALTSAVCLLALIPWELTRKDPIVDIRLLGQRQFGACFLLMLGTGAVLISTTQMLGVELLGDAGGAGAVARRHFHAADDDADCRQARGDRAAEISDHGRHLHRYVRDVASHRAEWRYHL
jgi:DHA2 family multidrug resistance protein